MHIDEVLEWLSPNEPWIIDAHVHLGGDNRFDDRIIDVARSYGIAKLCLSSLGPGWKHQPSVEDFVAANRATLEAMRKYPESVLGFCYVNPRHTLASLDEIKRCVEEFGMVGVKLWVSVRYTEPCVFKVVEQCIDYNLPILVHAWYKAIGQLPNESTAEEVAELGRRYPEAKLIMAHVSGDWEVGARVIKSVPNVVTDISGGDAYTGIVDCVTAMLGVERVVYGSDASGWSSGRSFASQLAKVFEAHLSNAQRRAILRDNILRLLPQHVHQ